MVTPRISLVAWEDRAGQFIFVAIPDSRGRYVRTDKSVALVGCTHCGAVVGEPCKSKNGDGYGGGTHVVRRMAARRNHGTRVDDVLQIIPDEFMGDNA